MASGENVQFNLNPEGVSLDDVFGRSAEDVHVETGFGAEYAASVNYGAEPHWPSLISMLRWTEDMGWENYDLSRSDSEDLLWEKVKARQQGGEPLPSAYLMARHIAENGTEPMLYATDAFTDAERESDRFIESRDYESSSAVAEADPDLVTAIAMDVAGWTLSMAQDYLVERVSRASNGQLLQSAYPPREVEGDE